MEQTAFWVLSVLLIKHYIADYFIQSKFQFSDKHIYGGPGGMQHAGIHGLGTFGCLIFFVDFFSASMLALLDAVLHYHIDHIKSSSLAKANPPLHPGQQQYWIMHGIDQMAHGLTYILIVWLLGAFGII